ncbi:hypothetical protein [Mycobacteroides abscessus]|uniref:hypothetical protein n=1 Tax=Mycobacteroides abscessus TaxID=36809 RepID=UPI000C258BFD|nr:hypothetical protein [Mycobacteroides abscessus]
MSKVICFLDCETTGVHRDRRAWEIAIIRRDHHGPDQELVLYVDLVDLDLANAQPHALTIGRFYERHPGLGHPLPAGARLCSEADAARLVQMWTLGSTIVGVVPSFDTECLAAALDRHRLEPGWHYSPECMISQGKGYLKALGRRPGCTSDAIAAECGVEPPAESERHTALGDTRWTRRWYDRLSVQQASAEVA